MLVLFIQIRDIGKRGLSFMMKNEKTSRFKDNMDFEHALTNLLGKRYYGYAGTFHNAKASKKCLMRAINRIKKTINQVVTTDERLLLTTSIVLEKLEKHTKEMSEETNNDWLIIANLVDLISLLLGYDWGDGKRHRQIFLYQTKSQEIEDYHKKNSKAFWSEFPYQ